MNPIGLLVWILIGAVILVCTKAVIDWAEIVGPLRKIILLIVALVFLLIILHEIGAVGGRPILIL